MKKSKNVSRRSFVKTSVLGTAGAFVAPMIVPSTVFGKQAPSNKINIGWIGTGRQGTGDVRGTLRFDTARFVAVADVDSNRAAIGKKMIEDYYNRQAGSTNAVNVKMYGDYKEILADKSIDA